MNHAKIALLEHPAHPVPPPANRVAKESSAPKLAPPAESAKPVPFKIKTRYQVPLVKHARLGTTTTRLEKVLAKMKDIKNHPIAVNLNTSTVPLPTKLIGLVLHAPWALRALVILLGRAF